MFTFSRSTNVVKITVDSPGNDLIFMSPAATVHSREGTIYINQGDRYDIAYPYRDAFILSPLNVNGRPSDDANTVAQWLIDNYFYGMEYGGGGGGGPVDYSTATLQTSQLSELQDLNTELATLNNKTAGALVNNKFDEKELVYLPSGDIDYISYKLASSEVARVTFSYDVDGNLTSLLRT